MCWSFNFAGCSNWDINVYLRQPRKVFQWTLFNSRFNVFFSSSLVHSIRNSSAACDPKRSATKISLSLSLLTSLRSPNFAGEKRRRQVRVKRNQATWSQWRGQRKLILHPLGLCRPKSNSMNSSQPQRKTSRNDLQTSKLMFVVTLIQLDWSLYLSKNIALIKFNFAGITMTLQTTCHWEVATSGFS